MKVALVGKFPSNAYNIFEDKLDDRFSIEIVDTIEKYNNLTYADIVVLRIFKINSKDLDRIKGLKLIEKWGTGFDTIDIEYAKDKGIKVCNVPGANAHIVAELVVLHMLAIYRNLLKHDNSIRNGVWTKTKFVESTFSLKDKIIGLYGGGNIGREVAKKLKNFGCKIYYYDIFRLSEEMESKFGMNFVSFEELLKKSDILSIHVPLTKETKHSISYEEINKMKDNSVIINASRGGIIDEMALYEALLNGKLLGAGLDCFEEEPINHNNKFINLDNVVLTPHIGGTSFDLAEGMVTRITDNIKRFIDGEEVKNIIN